MKKRIFVILSLALCVGLFCFLFFFEEGKENENNLPVDNPVNIQDDNKEIAKDPLDYSPIDEDPLQAEEIDSVDEKQDNKNIEDVPLKKDNDYIIDLKSISQTSMLYQDDIKDLCFYVLDSFSIENNTAKFSYPNVPNNLHLSVKLQVFYFNGTGDDTVFRYVSDEGWLSGNSIDNTNHDVNLDLNLSKSLDNYKVILEVKSFDLNTNVIQIYDALWSEDGNLNLICMETKS